MDHYRCRSICREQLSLLDAAENIAEVVCPTSSEGVCNTYVFSASTNLNVGVRKWISVAVSGAKAFVRESQDRAVIAERTHCVDSRPSIDFNDSQI